jgi:hypothetical protein
MGRIAGGGIEVVGVLSVLGILLISVAMLGSGFPRALAWLGVAAGVAGLVGGSP